MNNSNVIDAHDRGDRHCSVCRKGISGPDVKLCSKCKRRAYCSQECQRIDWVRKGAGDIKCQGHKNWCDLLCGEEDIDWEIAAVNGNGLGIVAKRLIPANYRIVVEGICLRDALGKGSSQTVDIGDKFRHSCEPNSGRKIDPDFETNTTYSKREIKAGEEITVSYVANGHEISQQAYQYISNAYGQTMKPARKFSLRQNFFPLEDPYMVLCGKKTLDRFQDVRDELERQFGIKCSASCPCRSKEMNGMEALIEEAREKFSSLSILMKQKSESKEKAMSGCLLIGELLELNGKMNPDSSSIMRVGLLQMGVDLCIQMQDSFFLAVGFLKEAYEIWSSTFMHPQSGRCKNLKHAFDNIKYVDGYLRFKGKSYKSAESDQLLAKKFKFFLEGMESQFNKTILLRENFDSSGLKTVMNNQNQNIINIDGHDRHCSVCRKGVSGSDVKLCSKCKRRAYCSRECQRIDWAKKGTGDIKGQGHKQWCDLLSGEEDIDWKVTSINGKGLGIVAKRLIPANYRIIVERCGLPDFFGNGKGSVQTFGIGEKFNHSCDPNSCRSFDPDFGTYIIYSKREIKEGEEITITYVCYRETFIPIPDLFGVLHGKKTMNSFQDARDVLERQFGIKCSTSCSCRNNEKEMDALRQEGKEKMAALHSLDLENYSKEDAIIACLIIGDLLELNRRTDPNSSVSILRADILEKGFDVCIQMQDSVPLALRFIKEAHEILSSAPRHPQCKRCKKLKSAFDDPEHVKGYLRFEQKSYKLTKRDQMMTETFNKFLEEMASNFNM